MKSLILKIVGFVVLSIILGIIWRCKYLKEESGYFTPKVLAVHSGGQKFVGSETCVECHEDVANSHFNTAHFNTSAIADPQSVKGTFDPAHNSFLINDAKLEMVEKNGSFYQNSYPRTRDGKPSVSKLDLAIGSGVKGKTYLTWEGDKLYQLQASYYAPTEGWINSPSYPPYTFKRPITDDCLKCHVTYAQNKDPQSKGNEYFKDKIIFGVDCERCHGPLEAHVVYQRANPDRSSPKFVIAIDSLSRQKQLDVCIQCHSGLRNRQMKGTPFSFQVGENLEDYSKNYNANQSQEKLDVHGNQYGLLTASQCFINSSNMNCTTCHDPHRNQRGDMNFFNSKCMACHTGGEGILCNKEQTGHIAQDRNCVSCHMPLIASDAMKVQLKSDSVEIPVYIRTHLIKVYRENNLTKS